jgi:hypothetical protein
MAYCCFLVTWTSVRARRYAIVYDSGYGSSGVSACSPLYRQQSPGGSRWPRSFTGDYRSEFYVGPCVFVVQVSHSRPNGVFFVLKKNNYWLTRGAADVQERVSLYFYTTVKIV